MSIVLNRDGEIPGKKKNEENLPYDEWMGRGIQGQKHLLQHQTELHTSAVRFSSSQTYGQ